MIESYYSPFVGTDGRKKTIYELTFDDLHQIQKNEIEEGYQIEYKREISPTVRRKIPNIIASFANEIGGWLFFGIDEEDRSINLIEKKSYELLINNMLKDATNPIPRIVARFLTPPNEVNHGVFVIWIPEGNNPPYISYGKIYRRIGSSSSPVKEIEDRYHLDRLYQKSEERMRKMEEFCTKELTIYNRKWPVHGKSYVHFGMCNMYLIPTYDLKLTSRLEPEELKQYILKKSKQKKTYTIKQNALVSMNLPFLKASYSAESIVFRNSDLMDAYDRTIAWEQFFNGSAKFHIPIPYQPSPESVIHEIQKNASNYVDEEMFFQFQYVDAKQFLSAVLGCFIEYFECMKNLSNELDEMIIVIDLDNIRNDVLYFDTTSFREFVRREGIVFSDKNKYRFNKSYLTTKLVSYDLMGLLQYFDQVINAFGLSKLTGMELFLDSMQ